ncbi:MAG: lysophospholipid acyltransferase family protein, partial [Chloroflexota bacterium]
MKRLLRGAAVRRALAWLLGLYLGFALRSTRWTVEGEGNLAPYLAGGPLIVACWHERLALMPALWLHASRRANAHPPRVFLLVSRHRDGQLIGTILRRFGLGVVLGSTKHGGAAGLKGSLDRLNQGAVVGIAPDGPRGPPRVPAPGVAALAALSGAPV